MEFKYSRFEKRDFLVVLIGFICKIEFGKCLKNFREMKRCYTIRKCFSSTIFIFEEMLLP